MPRLRCCGNDAPSGSSRRDECAVSVHTAGDGRSGCHLVFYRGRLPGSRRQGGTGNPRHLSPASETPTDGKQAAGHHAAADAFLDCHEISQLCNSLPARNDPVAGDRRAARNARHQGGFGKATLMHSSLCPSEVAANGHSPVCQFLWSVERSHPADYGFCEPGFTGSGSAAKSESGKPRTNLNVRSHRVRVKKCSPRSTKCLSIEPADSP